MGSSCSTAVEHTPLDREGVGLNTTGYRTFFIFSLYIPQLCVLNQVPQVGEAQLIFLNKRWMLSCAAWGKAA